MSRPQRPRPGRCGRLVALLAPLCAVSLLMVTPSRAADAPPSSAVEPAPAGAAGDATDAVLEDTRRVVRSTAEWLARGVDSWFGDRPFREGGQVSDGALSLNWVQRADLGSETALRFNARFRLPNLRRFAYFYVGRDDERETITAKPEALRRVQQLAPQDGARRKVFAGVAVSPRDSIDFRVGVRGALKPYVQLRYLKPWELTATDLVEFRQTFFWTVDDQLGSTTALSYEHAFSSTLAARWLSAATITRVTEKFEWSSIAGLYHSSRPNRLQGVELLASGAQGSGVGVTDMGVQLRHEQPVHRDWLVGEFRVGHFWPRRDPRLPRDRVWAVGAGLRLLF